MRKELLKQESMFAGLLPEDFAIRVPVLE